MSNEANTRRVTSSGSSSNVYRNLGPPDPIDYLRAVPLNDIEHHGTAAADLRRYDSDEDGVSNASLSRQSSGLRDEEIGDHSAITKARYRNLQKTHPSQPTDDQDPPARERPSAGETWPYRESLSFTRSLVFYGAGSITRESERACKYIRKARSLRQRYYGGKGTKTTPTTIPGTDTAVETLLASNKISFVIGDEGVAELYHPSLSDGKQNLIHVPNVEEFNYDYNKLIEMVSEGAMRSFCFQRLQLLSTSYKMHNTMNAQVEQDEQSNLLGTDFYRTMKIDNHIHAAAAPTAKQFVEFVRRKLENEGDTIVKDHDGKTTTLRQVFTNAGLDTDHLTIDAFNVLADYSVYQRFDQFNSKYSPFALADMRRIFLKTTNHIDGRYFAELLKLVISRLESSKGHTSACEMRLSIYGMERHEW